MLRRANLWMTGSGTLVVGLLLALLLAAPVAFDRAASRFAIAEVSDRLDAALPALLDGADGELGPGLRARLPEAVRDRLHGLDRLADPAVQALVARILGEVCACRHGSPPPDLAPVLDRARADLASAEGRIREVAQGEFGRVLAEVRRDVTVFLATTLALFLAAFLLGALKGRASVHLAPASLVLTATTLIMGAWYLLGQDWLLAAIFSDYWGLAYPIAAAVLAAFLADIAFLKGHVTTALLNSVLSVPISPC